jgi:hypothetical protein
VLAQSFEVVTTNFTWTQEERAMIELLETYALVMGYTPTSRKYAMSNLFNQAFRDIRSLTGYIEPSTPPSILFYSGHDFQVANILLQLVPSFNFTYVPYSSSIRFELYQQGTELYVITNYNGKDFVLERCDFEKTCELDGFLGRMN